MAVFLAFRIAVYVAGVAGPIGYRIISSGQPSNGAMIWGALKSLMAGDDWAEMTEAELSARLSEMTATDVYVTTWAEGTDLRKLQVRYSRAPTGGTVEDVAVTTHTFLKVAAGVASGVWTDPTDYAAVESAYNAYWASTKNEYPTWLKLDQYRWYVDNAAMRLPDHAPNPAVRVTEVDVAGTGAGEALPPQTALSITEITASRKSWGRFYLPSMVTNGATADGRCSYVALQVAATTTLYNACRTAGLIPVVYAPGLPARSSAAARRAAAAAGPGTAPAEDIEARVGTIYEVTHVQVDDLFDVIRSRRWDKPTLRTRTAVT